MANQPYTVVVGKQRKKIDVVIATSGRKNVKLEKYQASAKR